MARGRMIDNSIWDSEQFNDLNVSARLLYIALITLADDEGCFRADAKYWNRMVFYEDRVGVSKVQGMLDSMDSGGLIVISESKNGIAGFHPNWHAYQTLRKDRSKPSKYADILVAHGLSPRFTASAEDNLSEDNVSEVNKRNEILRPFENIFDSRDLKDDNREYPIEPNDENLGFTRT